MGVFPINMIHYTENLVPSVSIGSDNKSFPLDNIEPLK